MNRLQWIVPFILGIVHATILPLDPIDCGLIINETAVNLSTHIKVERESHLKYIIDLKVFQDQVIKSYDKKHEKNKDLG